MTLVHFTSLNEDNWRSNDIISSVTAGAIAGATSAIFTCPFDVIKIKIQTSSIEQSIAKNEGIKGFYKGLSPTLLGYLPSWAIFFSAYRCINKLFQTNEKNKCSPWIRHLVSATGAGVLSNSISNPLWMVRTRLMAQSSYTSYHYNNLLDAFFQIYRNEGIRAFYKGLIPSLFGVCHVAIQFPIYEYVKEILNESQHDNIIENHTTFNIQSVFIASICSKLIATIVVFPHDVLRTQLHNISKGNERKSLISIVKEIYTKESIGGFYKGLLPNILKVVPGSVITLVTYETLMMIFEKINKPI